MSSIWWSFQITNVSLSYTQSSLHTGFTFYYSPLYRLYHCLVCILECILDLNIHLIYTKMNIVVLVNQLTSCVKQFRWSICVCIPTSCLFESICFLFHFWLFKTFNHFFFWQSTSIILISLMGFSPFHTDIYMVYIESSIIFSLGLV